MIYLSSKEKLIFLLGHLKGLVDLVDELESVLEESDESEISVLNDVIMGIKYQAASVVQNILGEASDHQWEKGDEELKGQVQMAARWGQLFESLLNSEIDDDVKK